jgi:hypothetical protein
MDLAVFHRLAIGIYINDTFLLVTYTDIYFFHLLFLSDCGDSRRPMVGSLSSYFIPSCAREVATASNLDYLPGLFYFRYFDYSVIVPGAEPLCGNLLCS